MVKSFVSSNSERSNTVKWNIIFSGLIKLVNIAISLLLVPLTINYVNSELYGIWLSLSSIAAWFGLFDIGFGLGLRNRLTTAIALHKYKYGKILVSTTYGFMAVVFFIVALLVSWGCTLIDWAYLLNIPSSYNAIVTRSFQIVIVAFCVRMVLQVITNVSQAFQMTALANSVDMTGNIFSLIFVYILTKTVFPNLIYLSAVLCFAPLIAFVGANIFLYKRLYKLVRPSIVYIRKFVIRDIVSLGSRFFMVQFVVVVLFQTTNLIISHFCGPEQVTVYNIAYKYMIVSLMILTIIQSPIWSAYNDAYAKKDYHWMKLVYKKLLRVLLFAEICIFLLVVSSPIVYRLWIGNSVTIPLHITLLVGIYVGLSMASSLHAMIINGMGKIKLEMTIALLQGLIYIPLVYFSALYYSIEGVLVSLIIVSLMNVPVILIQVPRLLNQTASGIYNK